MQSRTEIILETENNKGKISILFNGKPIPHLYGYKLIHDSRAGVLEFKGKRLALDEYGQFFVMPESKGTTAEETATEEIDMLQYLSDEYQVREHINQSHRDINFGLKNVRETSIFNAKQMIAKRLG